MFAVDDRDMLPALCMTDPIEDVLAPAVIERAISIFGTFKDRDRPPCCFTTMSWLIDRPSPVPSPRQRHLPK